MQCGYSEQRDDSHPRQDREGQGKILWHYFVGTYEWFISGTFHSIFSDHGWSQVTETEEGETMRKRGLLCITRFFSAGKLEKYEPMEMFLCPWEIIY